MLQASKSSPIKISYWLQEGANARDMMTGALDQNKLRGRKSGKKYAKTKSLQKH